MKHIVTSALSFLRWPARKEKEATWLRPHDPEVSNVWAHLAAVQTKTPKGAIVNCRKDMADPDDTEFAKRHDHDFADKLYERLGVTPNDLQQGADGADL